MTVTVVGPSARGRVEHAIDQRPSTNAVQHLGHGGFHSRALAGREHDHVEVRHAESFESRRPAATRRSRSGDLFIGGVFVTQHVRATGRHEVTPTSVGALWQTT